MMGRVRELGIRMGVRRGEVDDGRMVLRRWEGPCLWCSCFGGFGASWEYNPLN